ncbi:MAG: hypothetical protein GY722_06695 [bacterium]|nr:hypothetical protein [bacterium]
MLKPPEMQLGGGLGKSVCVIALTLSICVWVVAIMPLGESAQHRLFDATDWNAAAEEGPALLGLVANQRRLEMLDDLVASHLRVGMTREQIDGLLGLGGRSMGPWLPPEGKFGLRELRMRYSYRLVFGRFADAHLPRLWIDFSNNSVVRITKKTR